MKLQFKVQHYLTDAVDALVETFAGQPKHDGISFRIDPGKITPVTNPALFETEERLDSGLRNAEIALNTAQLLANVHKVQQRRNLPRSSSLKDSRAASLAPNLDVEMETGTVKTYVYIKTTMELLTRYGWSKYVSMRRIVDLVLHDACSAPYLPLRLMSIVRMSSALITLDGSALTASIEAATSVRSQFSRASSRAN